MVDVEFSWGRLIRMSKHLWGPDRSLANSALESRAEMASSTGLINTFSLHFDLPLPFSFEPTLWALRTTVSEPHDSSYDVCNHSLPHAFHPTLFCIASSDSPIDSSLQPPNSSSTSLPDDLHPPPLSPHCILHPTQSHGLHLPTTELNQSLGAWCIRHHA